MTRLELCKMVHRYVGAGDQLPGTMPSSTTGQTGFLGEIVQWVDDAYRHIQQEQTYWSFRNGVGTANVSVAANDQTVALSTFGATAEAVVPFVDSDGNRFLNIHDTFNGPNPTKMYYMPVEEFFGWYPYDGASGRPRYFTILQNGTVSFHPKSDGTYYIGHQVRTVPATMTADSDTPVFPAKFHEAIAWRAVYLWALQRESANKYEMAKREYERVMNDMRGDQLPEWTFNEKLYDG